MDKEEVAAAAAAAADVISADEETTIQLFVSRIKHSHTIRKREGRYTERCYCHIQQ